MHVTCPVNCAPDAVEQAINVERLAQDGRVIRDRDDGAPAGRPYLDWLGFDLLHRWISWMARFARDNAISMPLGSVILTAGAFQRHTFTG